jgi:Fungal protein kinase
MIRPKDYKKLFWNVHHRFRCDPCCRFVCGLTIENTTARFWHFSRSAVMVSEPFDIITVRNLHLVYGGSYQQQDADKLIHIFVSLARTKDPSNLGFDPTITCITVNPTAQRQYRIEVHDNKDEGQQSIDRGQSYTFTTKNIIANYRAVGIRSRGTWVFEGIQGDGPNGTPVVIKDVWIDSDREVEGTILENVRERLKDSPEDLRLFLEPLHHGCVIVDGVKDLTRPVSESKRTMKLAGTPTSGTSGTSRKRRSDGRSVGAPPNQPTVAPAIIGRRGDLRKHYRIVFKGKPGRALKDLKSCKEVFTGLLGGVKGMFYVPRYPPRLTPFNPALRALLKAGYIHRDLSVGNVLLVKEGEEEGHGVLIDNEYAKKFPDLSGKSHDVRTVSSSVLFLICTNIPV